MCEQCVANAETILENAIPGYTLMRAKAGSDNWPEGWYGLVQSNDPDFIFPGPLLLDPWAGLSEEELDAREDELTPAYDAFVAAVDGLKVPLRAMPAMMGYELVMACRRVGYSIERDGTELAFWLMNHLAKRMQLLKHLNEMRIMLVPDMSGSMDTEGVMASLEAMGAHPFVVMPDIHFGMFNQGGTDLSKGPFDALNALIARDFKLSLLEPIQVAPKPNKPWYQRHTQRNGKPPRY